MIFLVNVHSDIKPANIIVLVKPRSYILKLLSKDSILTFLKKKFGETLNHRYGYNI